MSISEEKEMLELEGLIEEHGLTGKARGRSVSDVSCPGPRVSVHRLLWPISCVPSWGHWNLGRRLEFCLGVSKVMTNRSCPCINQPRWPVTGTVYVSGFQKYLLGFSAAAGMPRIAQEILSGYLA